MFDGDNVIEFIGKIINQVDKNNEQEIESNLQKFRDYLELTSMCDGPTLKQIDDILECSSYLIALKLKLGYVDVASIVLKEEDRPKVLKKANTPKRKKSTNIDRHYNHFVPSSSSSCGGGRTYSTSCGSSTPTYSSSCGGGGTSYSRC